MAEAPMVQDLTWPEIERAGSATETYRTFPRKIAPALVVVGGTFAFIGSLGAWLRSLQTTSESTGPQQVGALWGYAEPTGRAIAILAGVAVFIAAVSYLTTYLPRFAREGAAFTLLAVLIARLITLNSKAEGIASAVKSSSATPRFQAYNASFGWGAWLMLLGLVFVLLGFCVGALRELDLRRGKPE